CELPVCSCRRPIERIRTGCYGRQATTCESPEPGSVALPRMRGGTMSRSVVAIATALLALGAWGLSTTETVAQEKVLKIGQIGVMSGPAASWGLVNRYAAEAQAQMYN